MKMLWSGLDERDERVFWMTASFVAGRLCERSTLDWAMALSAEREAERRALIHVLHDGQTPALAEPWRTAWGLVEASWSGSGETDESGVSAYSIRTRVESGERSSELVGSIVKLVEPRLKVERASWWSGRKRGRPKVFGDLVSASLTSGYVVNAAELGLLAVADSDFLLGLANALDGSLRRGLALGRRIGWDGGDQLWRLGSLNRVDQGLGGEDNDDADAFHRGIAPIAKLLYAVASRLAEVAPRKVAPLLLAWRTSETAIDLRLWAALGSGRDVVPAEDVAEFLAGLDNTRFWDLHLHPEVALLRARRYGELAPAVRGNIAKRLRHRPPRKHWPRRADAERLNEGREYWAARELQRIAVCGGVLPARERAWLQERLVRFGELATMDAEEGFLGGTRIVERPTVEADASFGELAGEVRLRALQRMLADPEDSAKGSSGRAWLGQRDNLSTVVVEIAGTAGGAVEYSRLLVWVLRIHGPTGEAARDGAEAAAMLGVLAGLPAPARADTAGGVSEWMGRWCKVIAKDAAWKDVWLKVWPAVVEATNAIYRPEDQGRLNVVVAEGDDEKEPGDLDTLNTPVASLVDVFLKSCPAVKPEDPNPFDCSALGQVRDALTACEGQALLIVRHRLIRQLQYFLSADHAWAEANLIAPLLSDEAGRLALWRAVARANLRRTALALIGAEVAKETANPFLGHRTRTSLVFSLVVESLFALLDGREPAVDATRVQQMLRVVDDEIRGEAAEAIVRFVRDVSKSKRSSGTEEFKHAAAPFLRDIWPLERMLATRGVSRALAELPARSGTAFAEAVTAVERFLVPFACHSLVDYGLYGKDGNGVPKLNIVDDERKGLALLRLLDLTVGASAGSVVPFDLRDALDRIRSVKADLAERAEFRRLWSLGER